jgi:hypothetical protein
MRLKPWPRLLHDSQHCSNYKDGYCVIGLGSCDVHPYNYISSKPNCPILQEPDKYLIQEWAKLFGDGKWTTYKKGVTNAGSVSNSLI